MPKRKSNKADSGHRGFEFRKERGQHILKNPLVVNSILEKANIKPTDIVLEVGPGTGNMTVKMLALAKKVIAIEIDPRMIVELHRRVQFSQLRERLELIQGDVLKMELPYFDICVANIPYQISSPLIFKLLAHRPYHRYSVLMLQREFAMRLIAQPGTELYCRLSVNTKALAKVTHLMKISRNSFRPPPKVDSSVVRIEPRNPLPPGNFLEWDGLLRICFQRKNKTLGSIMKQRCVLSLLFANEKLLQNLQVEDPSTQLSQLVAPMVTEDDVAWMETEKDDENDSDEELCKMKEKIGKLLEENNFSQMRASKMTLDDFRMLLKTLNEAGLHFC
eukprot:jgi/Galph1/4010/GphlegSOOS_G2668.1